MVFHTLRSYKYLLHFWATTFVGLLFCSFGEGLFIWVNIHSNFEKLFIQEWYPCLQPPGHRRSSNFCFRIGIINKEKRTCLREGSQRYEDFLRDEHILGEMMHHLEQRGSKDNLEENECDRDVCTWTTRRTHTPEDFVAAFPTEHHLYTHGLYFTAEEVHRRTRSHGGDIVSFKVMNDFRNCVQTFLYRKNIFMMNSS